MQASQSVFRVRRKIGSCFRWWRGTIVGRILAKRDVMVPLAAVFSNSSALPR
jgi:hypothetical protein